MNLNYLSNKEGVLRAFTFFKERYAEKPSIFTDGTSIKPMPSELYVNKEITVGGGKVSLLIGSTDNEIGVTNFDGNKLEEGRAFAIDGIGFHLAIADSKTKPYNVDFSKGLSGADRKAFQFAILTIRQKNEVIASLPISSILNGQENTYNKYRDIDLSLIEPKTKVEIEIEFPEEVEAPTLADGKAVFVSTVYRGYETYQKR
ncbi:hypothetical protein PL373_09300 [Tenacibaculum maritimum]|nr:hypothetical protein [Tenacibaculum maritimum]MDB0601340.1 hypothetical protein [Tenacibaculum maritimum]MDB0611761.1 hypothetical protein [Tenacibaculum maritimum]